MLEGGITGVPLMGYNFVGAMGHRRAEILSVDCFEAIEGDLRLLDFKRHAPGLNVMQERTRLPRRPYLTPIGSDIGDPKISSLGEAIHINSSCFFANTAQLITFY